MVRKKADWMYRARGAYAQLSKNDQKQISKILEQLTETELEDWPQMTAELFSAEKRIWKINATADFRVFVQINDAGELVIRDILHKEALKFLAGASNTEGAST